MKLITIDMDALAKAIDCNTDATEQDARSIINTVLYHQPASPAVEVASKLQNSAPRRIYLDIGDQFALERVLSGGMSWQALEGVTWSEDNATSHGVEYVRADLAATPAVAVTAVEAFCDHFRNGRPKEQFANEDILRYADDLTEEAGADRNRRRRVLLETIDQTDAKAGLLSLLDASMTEPFMVTGTGKRCAVPPASNEVKP